MHKAGPDEMRKIAFRLSGPVALPWDLRHLWEWFSELSDARGGGMGPSPITYQDILAWSRLTGRRPSPWEVSVIRELDSLWLSIMPNPKSTSNPLITESGEIDTKAIKQSVDRFFDMMGIEEVPNNKN
ncbi:hypothetical protein [Azospirillum sp. TSO5]|uniref:phage tail assembly chaperone n=1 Tax=Azospirillum sp. TSO5 TaxID=716760 RepID=UPI0011B267AA|nr:hypothetical protein [Azospirillum sp. TSO5]